MRHLFLLVEAELGSSNDSSGLPDSTCIFSPPKQGDLIHTAYWDQSPKQCPDTVLDGASHTQPRGGYSSEPVQFIGVDRVL